MEFYFKQLFIECHPTVHNFTLNKRMHIHNKRYVKIKLLKGVSSIINIEP